MNWFIGDWLTGGWLIGDWLTGDWGVTTSLCQPYFSCVRVFQESYKKDKWKYPKTISPINILFSPQCNFPKVLNFREAGVCQNNKPKFFYILFATRLFTQPRFCLYLIGSCWHLPPTDTTSLPHPQPPTISAILFLHFHHISARRQGRDGKYYLFLLRNLLFQYKAAR